MRHAALGDAPGADGKRRAAQRVSDFCLCIPTIRGGESDSCAVNAGACSRNSPKQLRLELVIAKALAGQMNKVEGGIEAAGRALKHSALVRPSGSPPPVGAAVNR